MPEVRKSTLTVGALRVNDVVTTIKGLHDATVEKIVRKQVWDTVTVACGGSVHELRVRDDDTVEVSRVVATEAEVAQQRYDMTVQHARGLVNDWLEGPLPALEKIVATANEFPTTYEIVSHWDLDRILKAQAMRKIALTINSLIGRDIPAFEGDTNDDERLLTAVALVLIEGKEKGRYVDPLSRSTSITSNLVDDLDLWAHREFVDKLRWAYSDVITKRVARLEANR